MPQRAVALVMAMALAGVGAGFGFLYAQSTQSVVTEVRIEARQLDDGRVEFALEHDGKRILPPSRYFPADPNHSRWLRTSPIEIEVELPPSDIETTSRGTQQEPIVSVDRIQANTEPLPPGFRWSTVVGDRLASGARIHCANIGQGITWRGGDDGSLDAILLGFWVMAWHGYDMCAYFALTPIDVGTMPTPPISYHWAERDSAYWCPADTHWVEPTIRSHVALGINQLKRLGHDVCAGGSTAPTEDTKPSAVDAVGSPVAHEEVLGRTCGFNSNNAYQCTGSNYVARQEGLDQRWYTEISVNNLRITCDEGELRLTVQQAGFTYSSTGRSLPYSIDGGSTQHKGGRSWWDAYAELIFDGRELYDEIRDGVKLRYETPWDTVNTVDLAELFSTPVQWNIDNCGEY